MKQTILILMFFVGISGAMYSKQLMILPEIMEPIALTVDGDNIYISQKDAVYMYSKKTLKYVKKFGKKGEGPGEFRFVPSVTAQKDHLLINTFGKILFFSKDGKFLKEKKTQVSMSTKYAPVGNKWVGMVFVNDMKAGTSTTKIVFFDSELKSVRDIAGLVSTNFKMSSDGKMKMAAVRDLLDYKIFEDKIFLGNTSKGFYFEILDKDGKQLYQINKEYKKPPFTEKHKKEFLEAMEQNPMFKRNKNRFEFEYRDFFPAYRGFQVKDGKFYVFTNETKDKTTKVVVMDLKGNVLKTVYLPSKVLSSIHNDRFYYMREDEETEEWKLYVEEI